MGCVYYNQHLYCLFLSLIIFTQVSFTASDAVSHQTYLFMHYHLDITITMPIKRHTIIYVRVPEVLYWFFLFAARSVGFVGAVSRYKLQPFCLSILTRSQSN